MRLLSAVTLTALIAAACGGAGGVATTTTTTTTQNSTTTTTLEVSTTIDDGATTSTTTEGEESPGMLLVLGDWGSVTAPQGAVAGAMARFAESNDIEAILTTGDNFYNDDAELVMTPFDWVEAGGIDYWIAWGNHDLEDDEREQAVLDAFDSPPKWTTHEWGEVTVVILDSNHVGEDDQIEFLDETLAEIEGPTIVVFHHPAYSCSRHGDSERVKEEWVPRFDDDVVLVLAGHDHNYQRIEEDDRTYVVTGGGGNELYDLEPCTRDVISSAELHHFLVLQQNDHVITGTAVDVNGNPFDEFFINLGPGVLDG
jgi:hypothetical protein